MLGYVGFFLKQKTAYEMRISDWSSDVCSSDLAAWRLSEGPIRTDFLTPYLQAAINEAGGNSVGIGSTFLVWEEGSRGVVMHAAGVTVRDPEGRTIGRATCRERVCQSV